jgi:hypothetical protein
MMPRRRGRPHHQDEEIGAAQVAQNAWMASIVARQCKLFEELGHAVVEHRSIVATGLVAERRGQPTFADAGWSNERQIVVGIDPVALGQLLEQRAVKTARTAIINIFDAGLLAQLGIAQAGYEPFVAPPRRFAIKEEPKPFAMTKVIGLALCIDFGEGLGHALKAERVELIERWMIEQNRLS